MLCRRGILFWGCPVAAACSAYRDAKRYCVKGLNIRTLGNADVVFKPPQGGRYLSRTDIFFPPAATCSASRQLAQEHVYEPPWWHLFPHALNDAALKKYFVASKLHRLPGYMVLSTGVGAVAQGGRTLVSSFWRISLSLRNRPNQNDSSKKKRDSKGGGDPDFSTPPSGEENTYEEWLVPRACLFVVLMFSLSGVLWLLARPTGRNIGWTTLNAHAGEIQSVSLYNQYAQVYLDKEKVYLGLVSDQHTHRHMEELSENYAGSRGRAMTEQPQPGGEEGVRRHRACGAQDGVGKGSSEATAAASNTREKPEKLEIVMKGAPLAERALVTVGVLAWVVPFIFFPVFVMFLSQHIGKSMAFAVDASKGKGKLKEMVFKVEAPTTTRFRDIAGMKEPKKEITEIVDFLRHPGRYTKLGAKIPTGALLLGPPGTGKTLLAKAVAGESGVSFIPVCGSDFVEMYVGMGALRVRQLFSEAKKQRCIVYIDEIDAIGLKRQGAGHGEKQEQEQTLNELLTQLDGFNNASRGDVMVLASSNIPQDALDPALIRPGRFDRIIHVDSPVLSERVDIFKVHLSKLKLVPDGSTARNDETLPGSPLSQVTKEEGCSREASQSVNGTAAADGHPLLHPVESEVLSPSGTATSGQACSETQLALSGLEGRKEEERGLCAESGADPFSFDFRSLLVHKSDRERALIDAYAERMSGLCPGFVGADIANVCNEGAIAAAREGATHVDILHLERSIDRVLAGIEHRSRILSPFEKRVVAHHEAGHAVAGWFLNRADPLMKVSIVPRGGSALGYAQYLPNENLARTAKEVRDSMSVALGGRVAEHIFFNHLSTGASDDLRKVTQMSYMYVTSFSPGSVYPAPGSKDTRITKPYGAKKSDEYDERAKQLVDTVYKNTYELLLEHKTDMEKLAQHLLEKELLTYQDVVNYLGTRQERVKDKKKGV